MDDIQEHITSDKLAAQIEQIIRDARQTAYRAVNFTMVLAYWNIGRLIVEDELHWQRADYGKAVLKDLSMRLTKDFGKGFDESNLRYMRLFYKNFPICDTLRHVLSWSHYRRLISVENADARMWYMNEAKQIFASKYKLTLPTEEELQIELSRARKSLNV